MAPRPSSPTSLLWAHQIKRENAHLLGRVNAIETTTEELKSHVSTIDAFSNDTCETVKTCASIEMRVRLIEEDDKEQQMRFGALDKDRNDRIEKQESTLKLMEKKVKALETRYVQSKEEHTETARRDKEAALKRIENLETALETLTANNIAHKRKELDNIALNQTVSERVKQLEERQKHDHSSIDALNKRLKMIEQAKMYSGEQQVTVSNADRNQQLQLLSQTPILRPPSPPLVQIQMPSSPLAKRRLQHTDGTAAKRRVGVLKQSAAKEVPQFPAAQAKKSQVATMKSPTLLRTSQRYRT
jgi:hypothetical protein